MERMIGSRAGAALAVSVVLCVGAFLLNVRAWYAGYRADALGLLGCHFLRAVVLLVAWWAVVVVLLAAAGKESPPGASGFTVLHKIGLGLVVPGCLGCYPLWVVIAAVLAFLLVGALRFPRDTPRPAWWRLAWRPVAVALLFVVTWYQCASTTRHALLGLGERLEETCGSDRLLDWTAEVIDARKSGKHPSAWLAPEEVPDDVLELLGPGQGVRGAMLQDPERGTVLLFTGGSGYHFQITVSPWQIEQPPPAASRWLGTGFPFVWQPGIELGTGGK
jgi:hypothetical protein